MFDGPSMSHEEASEAAWDILQHPGPGGPGLDALKLLMLAAAQAPEPEGILWTT